MFMDFSRIAPLIMDWLTFFPNLPCSASEIREYVNAFLGTSFTTEQIRTAIDYHISCGHFPAMREKAANRVYYKI